MRSLLPALFTLLAACADPTYFTDLPTSPDSRGEARQPDSSDYRPSEGYYYAGEPLVFAHTQDTLYKVDPESLKVTLIGPFGWPSATDKMTDVALDKLGNMIGVSATTVYSVNTKTAACTRLATLQTSTTNDYVGLTFVFSEVADGKEGLWATSQNGDVAEIDPGTGASKKVGFFNGPGSSGDVVSVKGLGTLATVTKTPFATGNDWLARINPLSGAATLIGDTGFEDIWGLGYWKGKVYGFTANGEFILIDPQTGKGTLVQGGGPAWWGAGVTTAAPNID